MMARLYGGIFLDPLPFKKEGVRDVYSWKTNRLLNIYIIRRGVRNKDMISILSISKLKSTCNAVLSFYCSLVVVHLLGKG